VSVSSERVYIASNLCHKVTKNITTKDGQARTGNNKAISDHKTFYGKHKDWVKARWCMEAYLYKEKDANGIPISYVIIMDEDKTDPVPIEDQDFWETPLRGDNSIMTTRRSIKPFYHG